VVLVSNSFEVGSDVSSETGLCTGVSLFCSESWNWSDEAFISLFSLAFLPMRAAHWKREQARDWVFAPVGIGDTTMRLHLAFGAVSVPVLRQHSTRYNKGMAGCVELEHGMMILGLPPIILSFSTGYPRPTHSILSKAQYHVTQGQEIKARYYTPSQG
jgi:hypothetical protein